MTGSGDIDILLSKTHRAISTSILPQSSRDLSFRLHYLRALLLA